VLSEQLISNNDSPGELGLGTINDIVCLSFQHAPRGMYQLPSSYRSISLTRLRRTRAGRHFMADTQPFVPSGRSW